MTLDEMPSWILSNIQFPQEAYKYGIAGIEQVVLVHLGMEKFS